MPVQDAVSDAQTSADDDGQDLTADQLVTRSESDSDEAGPDESDAADETAGEAADDDSEDGQEGADASSATTPSLREIYRQETGREPPAHIKSDFELLRCVLNEHGKIGERNEDAILGRRLKETLGQRGIEALLAQQQAAQQSGGLPAFEEFQRLVAIQQAGKASPEIEARIAEINERSGREFYELARRAEQLRGLAEQYQKGELLTRQQAQVTDQATQARAWLLANKADLYEKGNYNPSAPRENLSAVGREAMELLEGGFGDWDAALAKAKRIAAPPKPPGTRKKPNRSIHATPIGSPAAGESDFEKTVDAYIEQGCDPETALLKALGLEGAE